MKRLSLFGQAIVDLCSVRITPRVVGSDFVLMNRVATLSAIIATDQQTGMDRGTRDRVCQIPFDGISGMSREELMQVIRN